MSLELLDVYGVSGREDLRKNLIGASLQDIPTPAAIVDRTKVQRNCQLMLDAVQSLKVKFRAHVKTHKTTEITKLQVGENCADVRLIVSTVIEAEYLLPLLLSYKSKGAKVNVLYGVPPGPLAVARLARISKQLGESSISFMIDNPNQLFSLKNFNMTAGFSPSVFLKVDAGTHRAGVNPESTQMADLVKEVSQLEKAGDLHLQGFYSHAGHSYGGSSPDDAMNMLAHEISTCTKAAKHHMSSSTPSLILSVGASPTVLSIQNLRQPSVSPETSKSLTSHLSLDSSKYTVELHAGVYPLLDMQQIATNARPLSNPTSNIALSILAEVISIYPERPQPEALIAAGSLALAREPCKDYKGWGVLSLWGFDESEIKVDDRLIVSRVSQEHGIVGYEKEGRKESLPLKYGQKLRIWPNHACITSAMYDWYLVVDSSSSEPDKIIDVWPRCRGW